MSDPVVIRTIGWFEDPALDSTVESAQIRLEPQEQFCNFCLSSDMPCVTPFMSALFPDQVFCSATCVIRRWETENSMPYLVEVQSVTTLDVDAKQRLFRNVWEENMRVGKIPKEFIDRIKRVDKHIGHKFVERHSFFDHAPTRIAQVGRVYQCTSNPVEQNVVNERHQDRLLQLLGHFAGAAQPLAETNMPNRGPGAPDSFIAVSYCWHSSDWEVVPSIRDKAGSIRAPLVSPITQKMLAAISLLCKHESEGIWIDQLCIDQFETTEKRHAIATMDTIYTAARVVAIVLEDIELSRQELRVWRKLRQDRCLSRDQAGAEEFVVDLEAARCITGIVTKLLSARWTQRAWCFQEYVLSRRSVFLFPCEGNIVLLSSKVLQRTLDYRRGIFNIFRERYSLAQGFTYKAYADSGYKSIADLLVYLGLRHSQFFADKISLLLNIYGANLMYNADICTEDELCYICIILAISEGDFSVLCHTGNKLYLDSSGKTASWAQWPAANRFFLTEYHNHSTSFVVVSPSLVLMDLFFLEAPIEPPSQPAMLIALELSTTEQVVKLLESVTLGYRLASPSFVASLAAGIDCGMEWMVAVAQYVFERFGRKRQTGLIRVFRENKHYSSQIFETVSQKLPPGFLGGASQRQVEAIDTAAQWFFKYILLCLAYELPLQATVALRDSNHRVACSAGPPGCMVAVAKELAGPEYASQQRLWSLVPSGGCANGGWEVVAKGLLFETREISERSGYVALRKQQRIFG